jgi:polyisoprenoid-binding protein YceI
MLSPLSIAFAQVLAAASPSQRLTIQEYAVDAGHTIVEFSVGFALAHVKGRFPQTHGTILYDPAEPERSSVSVVIETKSLDTGWPHRDEHLRTDDFFDVEKYPTMTFQSTRVDRDGAKWTATGPLTMHGVTKTVTIPFHFLAPPTRSTESRWMLINVAGGLRLSRKEFGILGGRTHNSWFTAARNATVPDSVDVNIELEGYFADAASQRSQSLVDVLDRIKATGVDSQLARLRNARGDKTDAQFAPYVHGADFVVRGLIADGRLPEALVLSRGVTELFPRLATAWLVRGFALSVSGDTRGAAAAYARAREVFTPPVVDPNEKFPQVDDYWYYNDQLVRTALEWGRVREAVGLARVLTDIYGSTARAHVTYGLALTLSGDSTAARAAFARALELDPTETRAIEWQRRLRG